MQKLRAVLIILFISFIAIGCGSGGGTITTDISGHWSGTFSGINVDCHGTQTYAFNQDGNTLSGHLTQSGIGLHCDDSPESFTGLISGNSVTLNCCNPSATIKLTLGESGNIMTGTASQSFGSITGMANIEIERN